MKTLFLLAIFVLPGCAFSKRLAEEEGKTQPALDGKTPIQIQIIGAEKIGVGLATSNPVGIASGIQDIITALIVAISAAAGSAGGAHMATRKLKKAILPA